MAMTRLLTRAAMGLALAIGAGTAQAAIVNGSFLFSVMTGETNGAGFNAVAGAMPFTGSPASASFTYTGSLNFDLNQPQNSTNAGDLNSEFFATATNGGVGADYGITGYSGSGNFGDANANYVAGLAGFLAGSASASSYNWGSFYTIQLGLLAAGTVLTVTHDDGFSIFQNGVRIGSTTAGPTSRITEQVTLDATAETILYYGRQNGSPSVLIVDAVPPPVPLPAAAWLLLSGLGGLGLLGRRGKKAA